MNLRTPICDLFGIEYPVFLAGMGGVAYADVCAAVSGAGGFGTLGMAGCPPEQIREEMRSVRRQTDKPFGVDLLAALPDAVNAAIDVIIEEGASAFVAGLGVPGPVIEKCHRAGLKVMVIGGKVKHAVAAEQAGCDAVVAQGTEAGGHTGLVAGMALIPQVVDAVRIPVLAAGSIVDGRGLAAALAFGAQGVWMGTRFIASEEARGTKAYKESILRAGSADTSITRCFSGKPMRVIRNAYVEDWDRRPDEIMPFPSQMAVSMRAGVFGFTGENPDEGMDPARACMPAGQGSGGIAEILPAGEIVRRVMEEARQTIGRLGRLVAAVLAVGLLAAGGEARATDAADELLARAGQEYYFQYCASCHGPGGQGDGPAAGALRTRPADLTRIAARRGGHFPEAEISRYIDGRADVAAHGSREMPVWGVRFGENLPDETVSEEIVRGRLLILVEFLKSIQRSD